MKKYIINEKSNGNICTIKGQSISITEVIDRKYSDRFQMITKYKNIFLYSFREILCFICLIFGFDFINYDVMETNHYQIN